MSLKFLEIVNIGLNWVVNYNEHKVKKKKKHMKAFSTHKQKHWPGPCWWDQWSWLQQVPTVLGVRATTDRQRWVTAHSPCANLQPGKKKHTLHLLDCASECPHNAQTCMRVCFSEENSWLGGQNRMDLIIQSTISAQYGMHCFILL